LQIKELAYLPTNTAYSTAKKILGAVHERCPQKIAKHLPCFHVLFWLCHILVYLFLASVSFGAEV